MLVPSSLACARDTRSGRPGSHDGARADAGFDSTPLPEQRNTTPSYSCLVPWTMCYGVDMNQTPDPFTAVFPDRGNVRHKAEGHGCVQPHHVQAGQLVPASPEQMNALPQCGTRSCQNGDRFTNTFLSGRLDKKG